MGYKKRNSMLLKERMRGKWLAAFSVLAGHQLGPAIDKLGENVTCPIDGDVEGFRLFKDANETGGGWKQNQQHAGAYPDGVTLLMHVLDRPFTEVFDQLVEWLEGPGEQADSSLYKVRDKSSAFTPRRSKKSVVDTAALREWLNNIWKHSIDLLDRRAAVARKYLTDRHIHDAAVHARDLRFNPSLGYRNADKELVGRFPCITALVRDNQGTPVAIHRTFLTPEGKKLRLEGSGPARKQTPSVSDTEGRVICLAEPVGGVLGLAEGLETALAVIQGAGVPVWSCLSASMMPQFVPPAGVHTLLIFVDIDRSGAGQEAAQALKENLKEQGVRVIFQVPLLKRDPSRKSVDWADQLDADLETDSKGMQVARTAFVNVLNHGAETPAPQPQTLA
ncbi:DUF7146 domain-containing protein [Marinobacterium lutimaris]|uniref:Toprim domain-containing protein n=1 Tax=Marinobacterium lutimaris TaxID=568106 RepID=A0A1H6DSH0_9GAMM|nr:toprim domain-containing protein [Marinobacterium lutimaris]SEG88332.1 Toprim domain-containing protein [Marinobacterium lutimaris]